MRLLLDTSVLIDHLRGRKAAVEYLTSAVENGSDLWSVTVVRTEILAGMRPAEEEPTMRLLSLISWQDVTTTIADHAGRLAQRFLRSHPGVDTVDYLIAAAASELDADLCTLNVKHFPMYPGLEGPY